jgi:hypothetical protein
MTAARYLALSLAVSWLAATLPYLVELAIRIGGAR